MDSEEGDGGGVLNQHARRVALLTGNASIGWWANSGESNHSHKAQIADRTEGNTLPWRNNVREDRRGSSVVPTLGGISAPQAFGLRAELKPLDPTRCWCSPRGDAGTEGRTLSFSSLGLPRVI